MKRENFLKGRKGEEIAISFLQNKGYEVIEKNWHTKFGEIDIIAKHYDTLVFVEVKLKVGDTYGSPEEMITKNKLRQVVNNAEVFLMKNNKYSNFKKRVDGVCVVVEGEDIQRITHYENISG